MPSASEIPASAVFIPPSISDHSDDLVAGQSYYHYSHIPEQIRANAGEDGTACVLGVDEAGRGPVIGPMVYGIFYLPIELHHSLLATTHHFDDSKVLTPATRATLMKSLCTTGSDLFKACGWAIKSLSAQDIGAGMLKRGGSYNLNAQAMDATIEVIRGVLDRGINVREIYIDTIGSPTVYQKKLERIFPTIKITVAKKADSLYPCVSAASVVAKVTRDVSCEALHEDFLRQSDDSTQNQPHWGSGYPSDARCIDWMKNSMNNVFGWGNECRFSWGTAKDMMEVKSENTTKTEWPDDAEDDNVKLSTYFSANLRNQTPSENDELRYWFGTPVDQKVF